MLLENVAGTSFLHRTLFRRGSPRKKTALYRLRENTKVQAQPKDQSHGLLIRAYIASTVIWVRFFSYSGDLQQFLASRTPSGRNGLSPKAILLPWREDGVKARSS